MTNYSIRIMRNSNAFDLHTGFRFQIDIPMLNNSDISNCKNNQNRLG